MQLQIYTLIFKFNNMTLKSERNWAPITL